MPGPVKQLPEGAGGKRALSSAGGGQPLEQVPVPHQRDDRHQEWQKDVPRDKGNGFKFSRWSTERFLHMVFICNERYYDNYRKKDS